MGYSNKVAQTFNNMATGVKCRMPKKDGTGPEGRGPKTGRGKGKCR
ncbi:MAG TPA: DUF5320 domain-containing protein [Patescibacteria group bacterium]|nr:DUF5320 domain-containing protein [Patescibacteria group bacterium]